MKFKFALRAFVLMFALAACAQAQTPAPTAVVVGDESQFRPESFAALSPSPEPFQFRLPTPGAEPISGWRPPLYPVPWALTPFDHFYFTRPIAADQVNWPVADYRYGGVFFAPNIVHTGVDIPTPIGTPIMAAGAGTVIWAGWGLFTEAPKNDQDPYGLAVAIRHDFGYKNQQLYTIYAHMSEVIAVLGQHVEVGDKIGLVGDTGATTGPHVHFEVRFPDNSFYNTYNPELWIVPPQGWGVLAGRVMDSKGKTLQHVEVTLRAVEGKKTYMVKTYGGGGAVNPDPYYNENVALGDLPAGFYKTTILFDKKTYQTWVEILPGQISYFTFNGELGFDLTPPPAPTFSAAP